MRDAWILVFSEVFFEGCSRAVRRTVPDVDVEGYEARVWGFGTDVLRSLGRYREYHSGE
jgi:hypothetical protein